MLIDCDSCLGQGTSLCDDCVVSFILHQGALSLEDEEVEALENLAAEGLIPELRLVPLDPPVSDENLAS
ncbi:MAG TPA: hypothetical protein VLA54_09000 [Acidimicrobiia bacterium]|jgi:hypothetical protein|nr:hypothetical protein [Acidimicrobiia bacterium]